MGWLGSFCLWIAKRLERKELLRGKSARWKGKGREQESMRMKGRGEDEQKEKIALWSTLSNSSAAAAALSQPMSFSRRLDTKFRKGNEKRRNVNN